MLACRSSPTVSLAAEELRGQLWDEFVSQLRDVRRRGGVELGQARMIFHDIHGANDLFVMVDLFLESLQLGTEVVTLRIEISIALEHGGHINELRDAYPSSPRGGHAESVRGFLRRAGAAFAGTGSACATMAPALVELFPATHADLVSAPALAAKHARQEVLCGVALMRA